MCWDIFYILAIYEQFKLVLEFVKVGSEASEQVYSLDMQSITITLSN